MSKHEGEKCGKLHITYILRSQRGITPSNIDAKWRHSNLICRTLKQSHVQNFSSICQSMYEKSAENGRTETRTDGRTDGESDGITPSKIDAKWRHSNLICITLKQSHVQNFSLLCQSMYEKSAENGRTDGRTDGHHHTIIRPVWRRAYKKVIRNYRNSSSGRTLA